MLALSAAELRAYENTLAGVYTKQIRVAILDRRGDVVEDVSSAFHDGSITVDAAQDVSRRGDLQLLDPKHRFGFDADTYQGGDLDLSRMVRVFWIVNSDLLAHRVSVPVHTGPITRLRREGPMVTIEAQGMEVYGLKPSQRTLTLKKGLRRTTAIRTILEQLMGETRMSIPHSNHRLPESLSITRQDQPWKVAQKLAKSLGKQLYYDGSGTAVLRATPERPAWEFIAEGVDDNAAFGTSRLTSGITTESDLSKVVNYVRVIGRVPKGKKTPVAAAAVADRAHPLSPWQLGPPGAPMYLTLEIQNNHLRTAKECLDVAQDELARRLKLVAEVSFSASPVPHLDPYDVVRAESQFEVVEKRLDRFVLPLGLGGDMEVGYNAAWKLRKRHR
jgi:hypothetical protein